MKLFFTSVALATIAPLIISAQTPFIPASFQPPTEVVFKNYKLVPLGPDLARHDYEAYMSSIDHLRETFSAGGNWPNKNITMKEAVADVEGEMARFKARRSFTYAVLTLDGSKELGCVYIKPSRKAPYDATVTIWVTKAEFDKGLETPLIKDVKSWLSKDWPFQKVAWPKREISAEEWMKLPDK